ncbi:MAG: rhomboid family intramembrane serine protease [Myxococcota bacterium]|nr:rhomboid family intramembrane serine protease [Myxococcota bacterium]
MQPDPAGHERFPLRNRPDAIVLGAEGFDHPQAARGRARAFTAYRDLTHLALSERQLWIATRRALYVLPRHLFLTSDSPGRLLEALADRAGEGPDGPERLRRMAEIDALGRLRTRPMATWVLAATCVLGFLLERFVATHVFTVGYFSPRLVADGDWWRVVTANLLHGFPLHLAVNLVGLLVVGRLLERALGSARTVCVMAASALGSMLASGLLVAGGVVGVSGVVFGLAGGVLILELRHASDLPAWWRFPRPLLHLVLLALAVDVSLGFFLPVIAGEAHLGGFLSGAVATLALTRSAPLGPVRLPRPRILAAAAASVSALAVATGAYDLLSVSDFPARHADRIASLPGVTPEELNNHAWFIAVDEDATVPQMEAALRLAERAVAETDGQEATILDTLAEVQFQLGQADLAVETIDRAIAREPDEDYYREQRRRFTGERAPDDRPPDPALPRDEDGLTV